MGFGGLVALVLIPSLGGLLGGEAIALAPSDVAGEIAAEIAPRLVASGLLMTLLLTLLKVAAFVAVMLVVGRRLIPWILHRVAGTRSRELFRLAVLAIALGVAFALNVQHVLDFVNWISGGGAWDASVRGIYELPARLRWVDVAKAVGLSLALSFVVTIFPARRAARMNPVEALRYE